MDKKKLLLIIAGVLLICGGVFSYNKVHNKQVNQTNISTADSLNQSEIKSAKLQSKKIDVNTKKINSANDVNKKNNEVVINTSSDDKKDDVQNNTSSNVDKNDTSKTVVDKNTIDDTKYSTSTKNSNDTKKDVSVNVDKNNSVKEDNSANDVNKVEEDKSVNKKNEDKSTTNVNNNNTTDTNVSKKDNTTTSKKDENNTVKDNTSSSNKTTFEQNNTGVVKDDTLNNDTSHKRQDNNFYVDFVDDYLFSYDITLSNLDEETLNPIQGNKISIYDEQNKLAFEGYTNENGELFIEKLLEGSYTYKNTQVVDEYTMNENIYSFVLTHDGDLTGDLILKNKQKDTTDPNQKVMDDVLNSNIEYNTETIVDIIDWSNTELKDQVENYYFAVFHSILNDDDSAILTGYHTQKELLNSANIHIPNHILNAPVSSIQTNAFKNNSHIKYITLPTENLTTIQDNAFDGCTNLTGDLVIPSNITSIGNDVFNNTNLTSIKFENKETSITGKNTIPDNTKIICYNNSTAHEYALKYNKNFELIDPPTTSTVDKEYTIDLGNGNTTTVVGHYLPDMEKEIVDLVNKERTANGLNTLSNTKTSLSDCADIRAYELTNKFDHIRPNGERALTSLYPVCQCMGENVAAYFTSADSVMDAWMNSTGHRNNILSKNYKSIGVSVFAAKTESGQYEYYYAQLFSCD